MEWTVTEQGPRAVVEAWRPDDGAGLYKAYLVGPGGRCLLGTLIPEGKTLRLRRTLSIDTLRRQGTWPVAQVEEVLAFPFGEQPAVEFQDWVLRQSARQLPRHTVRREGEGFTLIFPYDGQTPFPLTPAFCFARLEGNRLIFSFHGDGSPYINPISGKNREEVKHEGGNEHGESHHQGTQRAGRSAGV